MVLTARMCGDASLTVWCILRVIVFCLFSLVMLWIMSSVFGIRVTSIIIDRALHSSELDRLLIFSVRKVSAVEKEMKKILFV